MSNRFKFQILDSIKTPSHMRVLLGVITRNIASANILITARMRRCKGPANISNSITSTYRPYLNYDVDTFKAVTIPRCMWMDTLPSERYFISRDSNSPFLFSLFLSLSLFASIWLCEHIYIIYYIHIHTCIYVCSSWHRETTQCNERCMQPTTIVRSRISLSRNYRGFSNRQRGSLWLE